MLRDHGHKVVLYSSNNLGIKVMSKLKKLISPYTTLFNLKTYKDMNMIIKTEQLEIVHVHNTFNLISPAVYYAASVMKVPVVQTVHNFKLLCSGATFYRNGHICEECMSKGLICAVKHSCYRGSKLQTLACVINTKLHRMTGIYGKIKYICLTGFNKERLLQLKKSKSNSILFEVWKQMEIAAPKLVVCKIGPMEKWCKKFLNDNLDCNIEMKGFVSNKEVRRLIANSKTLVLPTQCYEGFSMTIVEAYSVGTPVIGADIGSVGGEQLGMNAYMKYRNNYNQDSNYEMLSKIYSLISIGREYSLNLYSLKQYWQNMLYTGCCIGRQVAV